MKLQEISKHISYEVDMFELSARKLNAGTTEGLETNVYIEAFVIHGRCLLDFLYPKHIKEDDVLADHFFEDSDSFRKALPEISPNLEKLRARAGKEIAHLTYKRLITPEEKEWHYLDLMKELNSVLVVFFNHLSTERKQWFPSIVSKQ